MIPLVVHGQTKAELAFGTCLDNCFTASKEGDYPKAIAHLDAALRLATAIRDTLREAKVLVQRGVMSQNLGDYNSALQDNYRAMRLYLLKNDELGLAEVYNNIGTIHHYDKNFEKAGAYYSMSLLIREKQGDPAERAKLYNNFGALLEDKGKPDSALVLHRLGLRIYEDLKDTGWVAVVKSNIGSCYARLGMMDSAQHYLMNGLALLKGRQARFVRAMMSTRLGNTYLQTGPLKKAFDWCGEGLAVAEEIRVAGLIQKSCDCLYHANLKAGNTAKALTMLERYVALGDSVFSQERMKELTRIEFEHSFAQRQLADSLARIQETRKVELVYEEGMRSERDQKRFLLIGSIAVLVLAAGLWSRLSYMRRSRNAIQHERERSERLLLNILPAPIAEELKERGEALARDVEGVSILFTDFFEFTPTSADMSAQELVAEINTCFKAFDAIATKHGIEKIKTIGDAYMAAGGLPEPRPNSVRDTVLAALEMQAWLERHRKERHAVGRTAFYMRAGIHTGPVVAGIVGHSKFQYDVWGDTVNIAARMESSCDVGRVNISASTFELLKDEVGLVFTHRGELAVKGRGSLGMYFVGSSQTMPHMQVA